MGTPILETRVRQHCRPEDLWRLADEGERRGLRVLSATDGRGWAVTSHSCPGLLHMVTVTGGCDCEGYRAWRRCTHWAMLLAELGMLPDPDPDGPPAGPAAAAAAPAPELDDEAFRRRYPAWAATADRRQAAREIVREGERRNAAARAEFQRVVHLRDQAREANRRDYSDRKRCAAHAAGEADRTRALVVCHACEGTHGDYRDYLPLMPLNVCVVAWRECARQTPAGQPAHWIARTVDDVRDQLAALVRRRGA
jgi:hypothetical protein